MNNIINTIYLICKNIRQVHGMSEIAQIIDGDLIVRGMRYADIKIISQIYQELNSGQSLGFFKKTIIYLFCKKLVFIIENNNSIIGFDIFYFNDEDSFEGTLHEGFIAILNKYHSKGYATYLRNSAVSHFSRMQLRGITTRISANNLASINSALKVGFKNSKMCADLGVDLSDHYMTLYFD